MRNIVVLMFLTVLQAYAIESYSQEREFTMELDQVPVKSVLQEIENNSEFYFLYNSLLVDDTRAVNVKVRNQKIDKILAQIFTGTDVDYTVVDRQIVLSPGKIAKELKTSLQPLTITGTVTDEEGEPLPGVTIFLKGTSTGTVTNLEGYFSIEAVNSASTIVFSYVGYLSREVLVGDQRILNIVLNTDIQGLEEVVVVGYGSQIKKNLSSSVSKVDAEKLANAPLNSFEAGLQGRAAGVQITTSSALGGSAIRVRVRGTSSASANSEPLYVIDGQPVESGEISSSQPGKAIGEWNLQTAANTNVLASLNPSDIESIEILKDAAAAAIYGSRGANGVVLITTKKGQSGKTRINASATFGMSEATRRIATLNADQYIELAQEAWTNMYLQGVAEGNDWLTDRYDTINDYDKFWHESYSGVLVDGLTKEEALNTDTDWIDEVLQKGFLQEYNVSATGGDEKTVFFISANLKDESTILKGNEYRRFGSRVNIEHQISKVFRTGAKLSLSHVDDQQVPTSWAGGVGSVTGMLPIWPVYKEDGSYFYLSDQHPVAGVALRQIQLTSNQFMANWFLSANLIEGLSFRTEFGTNMTFSDDFHFRDGRITSHGRSVSSTVIGNRISWNWKNILNYKKRIKDHSFDLLAATDAQKFNQKINSVFGDTYFNSALQKPTDAAVINAGYFDTGYAFMSYIGRLNYNFKGRYLVAGSIRADGSSRLAEKSRWGYFPAGSIGYIISEEPYFEAFRKVVNFLKIRASYGVVGNAEIGDHTYVGTYGTSTYAGNTGLYLSSLGDDELGWERTTQLDIGITFEAVKGRISGEIDYYDKYTTDLLLPYPVSGLTGVSMVTANVGELSNKGIEFMFNTINIQGRHFTWETNFTLAHNRNEVISLGSESDEGLSVSAGLGGFALFPGYPVGVIEASIWDGVDPATGEDTYLDSDGTKLTYSEILDQYGNFNNFHNAHRQPSGNPWPVIAGGLDNRFTWKNWYLNILFTYAAGMDFNLGEQKTQLAAFGSTKTNPTEFMYGRWQEPGDEATVSKLTTENINWSTTTEHIHRTDYLRLKDLTIGTRFDLTSNPAIQGVNVFLKFTNLLTFTKAPDFMWDPEYTGVVQSRSMNNLNAGESYRAAPQAKFYMVGVSLDF